MRENCGCDETKVAFRKTKKDRREANRAAFTLIELLVCVLLADNEPELIRDGLRIEETYECDETKVVFRKTKKDWRQSRLGGVHID